MHPSEYKDSQNKTHLIDTDCNLNLNYKPRKNEDDDESPWNAKW